MALRTIHSTFFPELTSLGEIRRPSYPSGISPLDRPHLPATRLSRAAKVHYKLLFSGVGSSGGEEFVLQF